MHRTIPLLFLAVLAALAGCAGVTSDTYCVEHHQGTATVADAGAQVDEGRCTSWLFRPSATQRAAFEKSHGGAK